MNENFNSKNNMKKISIIICVIVIICILLLAYFKFIKADNKTIDNNPTINSSKNSNLNTSNESPIDSSNTLEYDINGSFLMAIEDIFTIQDKGTVVTGKIERGTVNLNDTIQIIGLNDEIKTAIVTGIEMLRKPIDTAEAGDYVGVILKDIAKTEVKRGQVLAKPNSISTASKFVANVYLLTKDEDGRPTPIFNQYKTLFYFRTVDIGGIIKLPSNTDMVNPGDTINMTVELESPVAMELGTEFNIREGGKTIGKGIITKIY